MDAPSRYAFYDALLADVIDHPRTVIVSTHLIEEVNTIFERVAIIDAGRLLVQDDADVLRGSGASVVGPGDLVDRFVAEMPRVRVLSTAALGRTKSVTLYGDFDERWRSAACDAGLEVGPISLQDLFVHLTGPSNT
jgi:ABC-2 type transport system ATP-binding protein